MSPSCFFLRLNIIGLLLAGSLFFMTNCQQKKDTGTASTNTNLLSNSETADAQQAKTAQSNDPALGDLLPASFGVGQPFYKRMEGKIGNEPPTVLHLQYIDDVLRGTYSNAGDIFLIDNGQLTPDNGTTAKAYRQTQGGGMELIGYIEGHLTTDGQYNGTFTPTKAKEGIPFAFREIYGQSNLAMNIIPINKKHGQCGGEEACFSIKNAYLQARGGGNNLTVRDNCNIHFKNLLINQLTAGNKQKQFTQIEQAIDDAFVEFDTQTKDMPAHWDISGTPIVKFNDNNLLSIAFATYEYRGGVRPLDKIIALNIDLQNGQPLHLDDLFVPNHGHRLSLLIDQNLRKTQGIAETVPLTEVGFNADIIKPTDNFFITPQGIVFYYAFYEIAPPTMGDFAVNIPFGDLTDIINPNSLLANLAKY